MTSRKQSKTGEKTAIEFVKTILEENNGEMPVHHMRRQLTNLPQPIEDIVGSSHKQHLEFLKNHTKFFVVKYGIVYLAKANSSGNYGRVLTMVRGRVISHKSLLLEGNARRVNIPRGVITHNNIKIGDTVICNVNKSVNGTLISSDMRVVEASETPDTLETEPKICIGNKKKKKNRNRRRKKEKKDDANFQIEENTNSQIEENTNSNVNSRSIENGVGSVTKFSHEIGKLQFGDNFLENYVSFHIDDYYEDGQNVLNLEWYLKIGDKVRFDAVLDDLETKWKALVVWKGLKPEVITVIDKKRKLEDYLEKNNPLAVLNIVDCIPIVTIGGQSENSSKQKPSLNIEKENNNLTKLKVAKTSVVSVISNENSFKETGTKPKTNKKSNNTPINITTGKPLDSNIHKSIVVNTHQPSKVIQDRQYIFKEEINHNSKEYKIKQMSFSNYNPVEVSVHKPSKVKVQKSVEVDVCKPAAVIRNKSIEFKSFKPDTVIHQDTQCISVTNENRDKGKVMKRRASTTINENSFKETGAKPKNSSTKRLINRNVFKSAEVSTNKPVEVSTNKPVEVSTNKPVQVSTYKPVQVSTYKPVEVSTSKPVQVSMYKPVQVSTHKPVQVKSNEPTEDLSNYSYSETVRKVNERLIYWKEEKSESTLISCRKDIVSKPKINYFGAEERNYVNDNVYKPIKSEDKIKQENPNCVNVSRYESIANGYTSRQNNDLIYRQIEGINVVYQSKIDDDDDDDDDDRICCNSKCVIL